MTEPEHTPEPAATDTAPNGAVEPDAGDNKLSPETDATDSNESVEPDTFPREYVEELRQESARYRTEAKTAETLAGRLHTELVRATGKLADPTDLPFDSEHLEDPEKLAAAVDALIEAKPHLKARRVVGDVGQGGRGSAETGVNLLGMLNARA